MTAHGDKLTFRAWLVKQLVTTRWSAPMGLSPPDLAEHLGVTLSVLEEAIQVRQAEIDRRGRPRIFGRKSAVIGRIDYALIRLSMPIEITRVWREYIRVLGVKASCVLRSLIHHFLLDPKRPTTTTSSWHYRGQTYKISDHRKYEFVPTRVTRGAQTALDAHAVEWGVAPTMIVRGLVVDMLEGRVKKMKIVSYSELWGDPDRYLHPEKFGP